MKHKHDLLVFGIVLVIIFIVIVTRLYKHKKISKAEVITPAYLSINGWKDCLKSKDMGTWESWCLPNKQPKVCNNQAWEQLSKLDMEKC